MTHFMRKHKTLIFWALVLLVGVPMLFFGVDFSAVFDLLTGRGPVGAEPVASVYGVPITGQALVAELQQMASQMPNTSLDQAIQSGMAEQALDRLINTAIIEKQIQDRNVVLTDEYLIERLKQFPAFQNENGDFDARLWNSFVKSRRSQNWNELYRSLEQDFARSLVLEMIGASARVLESEVREEFEKNHTKLQVKHVQIDPKVEPTEDQLQATYDADPDKYALPGARQAQFVEFPLVLPVPPIATEIVEKARGGEDFAALAMAHSARNQDTGGEIGWISQASAVGTPRESLFDLPLSTITDPIDGAGGYYIFKVEDERISELTQERDIFVREIMIPATIPPEERQTLEATVKDLIAKAKEAGSLQVAAADLGLALKTTGPYRPDDMSIDNIHSEDVFTFRNFTRNAEEGAVVEEVIPGRRNLYAAQITEVGDPTPRSFEEAREDVERDTIAKLRQSPGRTQQLQQLASEIQIQAQSINEIPAKFPELNAEIKETQPFGMQDFLFQQGIMLAARSIYDAVGDKEPGAFAGPLQGFDGSMYFVELVQKTLPDATAWEQQYPEEKVALRERLEMMREAARVQDYLKLAREQAAADITTDYQVLASVLGLNEPKTSEPAEAAAVPEAGAAPPAAGAANEPAEEVTVETAPSEG